MKELLFSITKKDFNITYFSGTGAGGQHRNKHMNCVRLSHKDSGAMVTGQSHKERKSNIREALKNLIENPKFKKWHSMRVYEVLEGKKLEEKVDEMMDEKNIKVEYKNGKKWMVSEEV